MLTYRFLPSSRQLTLTIDDAGRQRDHTPILATNVTGFGLELRSSLWQYDRSVPRDGVVTWAELDATPGVGNQNGIADAPELAAHRLRRGDGLRRGRRAQPDLPHAGRLP